MSLDGFGDLARHRLSRRTVLRGGAFGIAGLAAAALVGCGDDDDDDDDDATPTATETPTPTATSEPTDTPTATATPGGGGIAAGGVIIEQVVLAGDEATVVLFNTGDSAQDLDGWYLCNFPNYWPIPAITLAPGARVTAHAGGGSDAEGDVFAAGGFGALSGGAAGEVGLYRARDFGNSEAIASYVAWNGGGMRKSVAQAAGIWGGDDVSADDGVTIAYVGGGTDASAYQTQ